jgi:hypothetical protein
MRTRERLTWLGYEDVSGWSKADMLSQTLFPYAVASVCSFWRGAMSLVPEIWTRFVIFVDSRRTSLQAVIYQLRWSRGQILDIAVMSRPGMFTRDNALESERVFFIMEILQPHLVRCQSLRLDVMFSSSLPTFPDDFHGPAPYFKMLELTCREDDGNLPPYKRHLPRLGVRSGCSRYAYYRWS